MELRLGRVLLVIAGALLLLCSIESRADAQAICVPSTTPCQTCPDPPPCPPPTNTTCGGLGSNTTFTTSTVTCPGAFAQNTVTTTTALGPGNICIGLNKSVGFFVCPGTTNIHTNTDSILGPSVGVPTLSVWGFGVLVVTLGALALRRLRLRPI